MSNGMIAGGAWEQMTFFAPLPITGTPATRTHEAETEKMLRAEIAHNIAEYVMEHDAVVYERQEEENNDLQLSATFRFLQPHEGEWKI